jgi:hypothetical protein
MQRLWLVGRILGVGARLLVKHTFRSGEKKPLEVIYGFGLPRDAAPINLLKLASSLEPDGGMPGKSEEERVLSTILALLQFLAEGHNAKHGAFRAHVKRMLEFLKRSKVQNDAVKEMIEHGKSGRALPGDWSKKKPEPGLWAELEKAL